jgi:dimeric dUTPase (all-alpha-NTP-PPase superfamily)
MCHCVVNIFTAFPALQPQKALKIPHSKIENSYLEKNSCKILILSNILLKIRKTRENILIKK